MKEWAPYLVVGVASGSIYALAAMGLVLTFKTSGIFNFAHGAQAALAAYVMFELWQRNDLPWPAAALLTLVIAGLGVGLLLELLARALSASPPAARVGATIGLLVAIQGGLSAVFGTQSFAMPYFLPADLIRIFGVSIRVEQIIITGFVLTSAVGLSLYLGRTRLGVATLAVVDDPTLLALQGTEPTVVRRSAWVIGSTFAALSGMFLAPTAGLDATTLTLLVFYAFGAASIGGFQSLPLAYSGGMAIGIGAEILKKIVAQSGSLGALPATLPFLVLFVVLLATPSRRLIERGTATIRLTLPASRLTVRSTTSLLAVVLVTLTLLPPIAGSRTVLYTQALCFVILFASLGLLVRVSGLISLCQMTFAAVGAVTFAHLADAGVPWFVALLVGGVIAMPVGALVAIPAIRLSGIYLAIATFGFALLVQDIAFPSRFMFANLSKVLTAPRPHLAGFDLASDTGYYYVVLVVTMACLLMVVTLRRSRLGRLLRGLAEGPLAVDVHGTSTNITRVIVFCVAAFLAGIAGGLIGPITGSVSAPAYDFSISLLLVAVLFMGGRQPVIGAFVAAGLYIVVPAYLPQSWLEWSPVVFGTGAVVAALVGGIPVASALYGTKRVRGRMARQSPARSRRERSGDRPEVRPAGELIAGLAADRGGR